MRKQLTLEEAKARLERLEGKWNNDPLLKSFYGGRVGFRRFKTQAAVRKHENEIDKSVKEAAECVRLRALIARLEDPAPSLPKVKAVKVKDAPVPRGTFKLGFGCLGAGLTVWNEARMVSGDYPKVAHIKKDGSIQWYIKRIPQEVRDQVEKEAANINTQHS